jgi:polyhydroxyalkanoate synthesis regulator phasin
MDTDNTQDIIKARFQELPPEVQKAITATNLTDKFDAFSKKYSLRIDQSGNLQTETLLVMLGLEKPSDYVDNLVKNAELSREAATRIAADVNTEILGSIRKTLEDITSQEDTDKLADNTDLAQAGGINVEKDRASEDVVSANQPAGPQISKAATLDAIENPPAFVDRLLTGTSTSVNETVIKSPVVTAAPATPSAPTMPKIDPYREPIE